MKIAILSFFLFAIALGTGRAQITGAAVEPAPSYDTFVPPTRGGSYTDPVFGAAIQRVSNALATQNAASGGTLTWIENEYATMSAFNSDNSRFILVHESYFGLYDGDGTFLYNLPMAIGASSEPRWSRKSNTLLYYHTANKLVSYDVTSSATTVVHTFSQYSAISGNGEMDISEDGDHFVFAGDNRYIFVYQISTDQVLGVFDTAGQGFDSLYITPSNNVIVSWYPTGTARYTGQELFNTQMQFLRQVGHADGHKDVTRDTNGDEVLIWTNSDDPSPIANCQNGIVKIRLADATQTCLLQLGWTLAVHISAPDGNGTAFVDTEAPANPEPGTAAWIPYTNEVLQVKLDGSGAIRLAQHRSRPVDSYNWEPKLSTSRDGTRLLFASNYDLSNIEHYSTDYADTYLMTVPATGVTATTPAAPTTPTTPTAPTTPTTPPTTTSSVVQYLENNAAITYSGTWYPNSGSFNLGSVAVLAMDANAQAQFTFGGTGVNWIGYSDQWSGIAQVYLDGALVATVDTYSANEVAQKTQYSVSQLASGTHTLRIVVTGGHSAQSSGAWVWLNAFEVTTEGSPSNNSLAAIVGATGSPAQRTYPTGSRSAGK